MMNFLKDNFVLSDNQCRLVVIYFVACVVRALALIYLAPEKFGYKLFIMLLLLNIIYNIVWMKFFSD